MPGPGGPDRPDLDALARVAGAGAGRLGHPPELRERDPERVEELDHLRRGRRRPDVAGLELVEPQMRCGASRTPPRRPSQLASASSSGTSSPACSSRTFSSDASSAFSIGPRCSSGARRQHLLQAGLQLLPDPRDREEPGRPHLGQVLDDLPGVRTARDREAAQHRQVVADVALGDVRHRQVGDDPAAVGELDHLVVGADGLADVRVRDLHALGRTGGPRRVDQRQEVVGLDRPPGGLEVEVVVAARDELVERHGSVGGVAVDHDHVLERVGRVARGQDLVRVLLLGDRDGAARVVHEVLDLLGRVRVVDRERHRAEVHRRRHPRSGTRAG